MSARFPLFKRLNLLVEREQLWLLFSRGAHADSFSDSRAHYINSRTRLLALLFAVLTPLWIPVDYLILDTESFQQMAVVRLIFSLLLFFLSRVPATAVTFAQAQVRLVVLMVLPSLFYLATQMILSRVASSELLIFYSFLPFLIIVMHCVFPLTLTEGVGLAGLTIGLLSLNDWLMGTLLSFQGLANLWLMALIMGVAVWAQLSQLHMKLKLFDEANTDPLTGLLNRRTLMKQLGYIRRQVLRHGRPVSLLMMDLDHFKRVNDQYGHQSGDQVLKVFSQILQQQVRSSDYVARFGGEEFIAVLPESRPEEALQLASRILQSCRAASVELDDQRLIRFSVSIGVGQLSAHTSAELSLSQVDAALYLAKQQGRDRAVMVS